jgi:hypothetical protein
MHNILFLNTRPSVIIFFFFNFHSFIHISINSFIECFSLQNKNIWENRRWRSNLLRHAVLKLLFLLQVNVEGNSMFWVSYEQNLLSWILKEEE